MKVILFVGMLVVAAAGAPAAQDPLGAAKDLYASAAYEEALSTLSRLSDGGVSAPAMAREVDEYRAFCLYALGRTAEAESLAEAIVRREPLAELSSADASPRLEAMFAGVRKRILPGLIREQYRAVRGLLNDQQYAAAEPRLAEVRQLLTAAERIGAWDEGLSDMSVLVDGFLALARANVKPPTPASGETAAPAAPPPSPSPAAGAAGAGPTVYGVEDADVAPPVAVLQRMPAVPAEFLTILRTMSRPMIMLVTIDESGNVLRAEVRVSSGTSYDHLVVRAASAWKYKPATRNGAPVRYEKAVVINVK